MARFHARSIVAIGIVSLAVLCSAAADAASGYKGWRFGMSIEEVKGVADCKPYVPVAATGGLECPNFPFLGKKIDISFVFGGSGLSKIQLWLHSGGRELKTVASRWKALLGHLVRRHGELADPHAGWERKGEAALRKILGEMEAAGTPAKLQFKPRTDPKDVFLFSSLIFDPRHGFYLFLYFQPPR